MYTMVNLICMSLLDLQGTEAIITKWKNMANSGYRTHNPWIVQPLPLPCGRQTFYTIDKFKLIKDFLCYIYLHHNDW